MFELPEEIIKASNTLKREGQVYINPVAVKEEPGTYYVIVRKSMRDNEAAQAVRDYTLDNLKAENYEDTVDGWYDKYKDSVKINKDFISDIDVTDSTIYRATHGEDENNTQDTEHIEENITESEVDFSKVTDMTEVD